MTNTSIMKNITKILFPTKYIKKLELRCVTQEAIIDWLQQENEKAKEENTKLGLTLVELSRENKELSDDCDYLKKEVATLEEIMKSGIILDIKLEDGTIVNSVKYAYETPCYDTRWHITCNDSKIEITRRDGETYKELIKDIKSCRSIKDIRKLDESDQIYYD